MLTYKEFYIWMEGYLAGRLESKTIDITPIVEKMGQVKDDLEFDNNKYKVQKLTNPFNPINPIIGGDKDDLGYPPKIVM